MSMDFLRRFVKCFAIMAMFMNAMFLNCEALEPIMDYELILRNNLLDVKRYDRFNAPPEMIMENEKPFLFMKFLILHVYDLEEISGSLVTNGWLMLLWRDSRLKWIPDDHGGLNMIPIAENSIWTPDIRLFNNADAANKYSLSTSMLWNNGHVISITPLTLKTTCAIDHRLYPFDEHMCNVTLGIWAYFVAGILNLRPDFLPETMEDNFFKPFKIENPQWKIVERSSSLQNRTDSNTKMRGQIINTQLRLRRQAPLFKFMVIIPGILAMILTLALFCLPSDSSVKLIVGVIAIGIQLALSFMLGQKIPSGGQHVPVIVLLVGNSLVLTALSMTISIYVIRVTHSKNKTAIPECLKKILAKPIGKRFCFTRRSRRGEERLLDPDLGEIEQNITQVESKTPVDEEWLDVCQLVDRWCFVVYCIAFIIICMSSFIFV